MNRLRRFSFQAAAKKAELKLKENDLKQQRKAELKRELLKKNDLKQQRKAELKRELKATLKKLVDDRQPKKKTRRTDSERSRSNLDDFGDSMYVDDRKARQDELKRKQEVCLPSNASAPATHLFSSRLCVLI
jgi:hypothetical protein